MCGIAGFFHSSLELHKHNDIINDMLHLIRHRGPDENGTYIDDHVTLGNARLSIVDLAHGKQPMPDTSRRYWICYTGEIYNHKELRSKLEASGYIFKTDSDTEVALYSWIHWGSKSLMSFNGSFAFAIYDRHENSLILARDRYGKRPLYYYQHGKEIVFSSEIKSFLAYPSISFSFDPKKIASVFATWTPLPDETIFKGIKQLPMASYLEQKNGATTIYEYDALSFVTSYDETDENTAAERLYNMLSESVRARLMGDVEIGTYLSGGLDSAIVTKLAIDNGCRAIRSFSVTFADKEFDESKKQNRLSQYLGTRHENINITSHDIAKHFPAAVWHAEVPLFRTACVPMYLLSKKVKECGIKVALTGEGSDESFLGYDIFKETLLRTQLQRGDLGEYEKAIAASLHPHLANYKDDNHKFLWGIYNQTKSTEQNPNTFSHHMRFNLAKLSTQLLNDNDDPLSSIEEYARKSAGYHQYSPTQKAQWLEFKTLLHGYLLSSQGDRMSFANSVENRCPFLDKNIIDYAKMLPESLRLNMGINEKYILKRAFKGKLPPEIVKQTKQPYQAPDAVAFFKNKSLDYMDAALSESEICKIDFINISFYRKFMKKIMNTEPESISPRESQAFLQLLSLSLLNHYFNARHQFTG